MPISVHRAGLNTKDCTQSLILKSKSRLPAVGKRWPTSQRHRIRSIIQLNMKPLKISIRIKTRSSRCQHRSANVEKPNWKLLNGMIMSSLEIMSKLMPISVHKSVIDFNPLTLISKQGDSNKKEMRKSNQMRHHLLFSIKSKEVYHPTWKRERIWTQRPITRLNWSCWKTQLQMMGRSIWPRCKI